MIVPGSALLSLIPIPSIPSWFCCRLPSSEVKWTRPGRSCCLGPAPICASRFSSSTPRNPSIHRFRLHISPRFLVVPRPSSQSGTCPLLLLIVASCAPPSRAQSVFLTVVTGYPSACLVALNAYFGKHHPTRSRFSPATNASPPYCHSEFPLTLHDISNPPNHHNRVLATSSRPRTAHIPEERRLFSCHLRRKEP